MQVVVQDRLLNEIKIGSGIVREKMAKHKGGLACDVGFADFTSIQWTILHRNLHDTRKSQKSSGRVCHSLKQAPFK